MTTSQFFTPFIVGIVVSLLWPKDRPLLGLLVAAVLGAFVNIILYGYR